MKLIPVDDLYVQLTNHGDSRISVGGSVIFPGETENIQYVMANRKLVKTIEGSELEFVGYVFSDGSPVSEPSSELTDDDEPAEAEPELDPVDDEEDSSSELTDDDEESVDDFFGATTDDDTSDRDELEELTKDELQDVLRDQDKKISGNKDELIDRILGDGE